MSQNFKKISASLAAWMITFLFILGCVCPRGGDSGKPLPTEYFGVWAGSDGSVLEIASGGVANYKKGGEEYKGVSVEIDESGKVLRMKLLGFEIKKFNITQPPSGDRMALDNVTYRRRDSFSQDDYSLVGEDPKSGSTDDYSGGSKKPLDKGAQTSDAEMVSLVRETLLDFNEAIQKEDFSEFLRLRTSKVFRQQYTPEQMASSFSSFIAQKDSVGLTLDQVVTATPSYSHRFRKIQNNDVLEIKGNFNTTPNKTYFDNQYLLEDGEWKLVKIQVEIR
ncbi:MAG: hypothetical protein ACK419_02770 [Pyrinomonadaceae bacterium]